MRKGQSTIPFSVIEAATTTLILLSITYGAQVQTNQFVKEETLSIQVQRVTNAALAVNSMPKGYIELRMSNYGIKYKPGDKKIVMNYSGTNVSSKLKASMINYETIIAPTTVKPIEGKLCIRKQGSGDGTLNISVGAC